MGVGDFRRQTDVGLGVLEGLFGASDGLERVGEIVMRDEIIGRQGESRLIVGYRLDAAVLSVSGRYTFAGKSEQNPKPRIVRVTDQSIVQGFAISEIDLLVLRTGEISQLSRANPDALALRLGNLRSQGLRFFKCGTRARGILQTDVSVAQT